MSATPEQMAEAARRPDGRVDTKGLFTELVGSGRSEGEAADWLVQLGCPSELAWQRYYEAIGERGVLAEYTDTDTGAEEADDADGDAA